MEQKTLLKNKKNQGNGGETMAKRDDSVKKKVPELRFKGFTDDWEQRKFEDIAETRRGLTYKPNSVVNNGIRVLRSSNINEDTFIFDNDDVFVDENAVNIPYVKNGNILITSANGSSRLVGKHAIIRNLPDNRAVHGGFMLIASSSNPEFLNASMSSRWYSKFINLYVAGGNGAIGNLNKNDLDTQIVLVPSLAEQQQIGAYFKYLDNLITLHQRKLDLLKEQKKGFLQKMFPKNGEKVPELRFAGFADDWEERKFSDFTKLSQGLQIAISDRFTEAGPNKEFYITNEFLNPNNTKKYYIENPSKNVIANTNDILMTRTGNTGKVITNTKGAFHNNFFKIDYDPKKISKLFLYFLLTSIPIQKEILIRAGTSTIPDLNHKDFYKIKVYLPVFEEQQQIGSFFKQLDDTISLHQRKLDLLKEQKKGFLQKMFV